MGSITENKREYHLGWHKIVEEIEEIEELIVESGQPQDTETLWSLHMLRERLSQKRLMLRQHMNQG